MSDGSFVKAKADNLPKLDAIMIAEFFAESDCFSAAEFKGVKEMRSGRNSYGDSAIGYVELRRSNNICTVQCQICPEHKVRQKNYKVILEVDEKEEKILNVRCLDCAASEGGFKHAVAFLMWVNRKSEEPASTSVACYWNKPKLAKAGTSIKFITMAEFGATPLEDADDGDSFLEEVIQTSIEKEATGQLFNYYKDTDPILKLDIFNILVDFKKDCETDFVKYANNIMYDELCIEAAKKTADQYKSSIWYKLRFARVTASKLYDVAHSKKTDGVIIEQILGTYKLRDNVAMERGRNLENIVLDVVSKKLNIKFTNTGIILNKKHPILGASPDAISDDYVVEIKCPMNDKSFHRYITKSSKIATKYMSQIQLQMYLANKKQGLFCVASPDFESSNEVSILTIDFDKDFLFDLIKKAEDFWIKNIFPILLESVKHI